jgi:tRNA nucleotidyltransferase (CCA-adding enzyme)
MKTYLVGGAVRDKLLRISCKDKDWVVVGSDVNEMSSLGFSQVGADFPVFIHPKTKEEYALARTERKSGVGYQGFECYSANDVTLEEDLLRRDLTINAMAMNTEGKIVDPYNGQSDIQNKKLRHVSAAFSEDPLRVLRVARFAARFAHLGFTIADETLQLMRGMVASGGVDHLTPERVWQETYKALEEPSPWVYFETLRLTGSLKVVFPEIDALFGIPQPEMHHPEIDCGIHTLLTLKQACQLSPSPCVRFAALVHDLGKALTPKDNWPRHYNHEKLGLKAIKHLCKRNRIPNAFRELGLLTCEFHTHVHRAFELKSSTMLKVLKQCDAIRRPERFNDLLICCKADSRGRTGFEDVEYQQAAYFMQALTSIQTITAKALVSQGIKGKEIGIRLDEERIKHLEFIKLELSKNT